MLDRLFPERSIERQSSHFDITPMKMGLKVNLANTANKPGCGCVRLLTLFEVGHRAAFGSRPSRKREASATILWRLMIRRNDAGTQFAAIAHT